MILISPWIDVILLALIVYLLEYWFYRYKKANIFETKYMLSWWVVDIWLLLFIWFGLWYYNSNFIFPFWLNWFWYSLIVSLIIEFAVIQLYQINLNDK